MKNFARAIRHAWPYRHRLFISIVCAFLAAILWGLNLTSIYPVLKLLHSEMSPLQWVDEHLAQIQKEIDELNPKIDRLADQEKELQKKPTDPQVEHQLRDLSSLLSRYESRLDGARRWQWRYQVARKYVVLLPSGPFRMLAYIMIFVLAGVTIKCIFEFAQESLVGSVVNRSLFDLRNRFYRNAIHLDVDQFTEQGTSELMARFTNDMESVGNGLKVLFGRIIAEPLRALACIVIACYISWQLTLLFMVLVPVAGFVLNKVGRLMKKATRRVLEQMSSIYKILQESFQGIRAVKSYTMEPYERRRFFKATKEYCQKSQTVVNIDALSSPIIEVLAVFTVLVALLAGSYLVLQKQTHILGFRMTDQPMEAETLLQLYVLLAAVADPVRKLSSVFTKIQSANAASDRIFAYVDRQPRVKSSGNPVRLIRRIAHLDNSIETSEQNLRNRSYVEFRNVCFTYEPGTRAILDHVSFSVNLGETIAVVGPNGCGKSTLLGLLLRFFDPTHGSVLIDGHDIRSVHLRSLRQQIGLVTQDAILFADTIFNNIAYGSHATLEQVESAARQAFAHDFISAKPGGYQFMVGEGGKNLAGGEKQRVALARAILRNPSILILDEFTSQIDTTTDAQIHQALRSFTRGRTTFIITHRMHTLEIAHRIVVMDEGKIMAIGTHTELLACCPLYARLQEASSQRLCA